VIKPGRYRVDAEPPQLRVYEGEAEVTRNGKLVNIAASQLLPLDGAPVVKRFTEGADGLLDLWADERHSIIASKMTDSQAVSDPLFDTGQISSGDYLSYVGPYGGYIPLAAPPPLAGGYYGYANYGLGALGYGPFGFGYSAYVYSFMRPYRPYPGLSVRRPIYSAVAPIYTARPTGLTAPGLGIRPTNGGVIYAPRPSFAPRPVGVPAAIHAVPRVGGVRR
jgi:hypothetical protein